MASMCPGDIILKLESIKPGETVKYHRGSDLTKVGIVQMTAWQLYECNRVDLVQKRLGPHLFEYRAIGRHGGRNG